MLRRPELPETGDEAEQRKERGELNLDLRRLVSALATIGRGDKNEVASRKAGIKRTWAKDLETGRNVQIVVRNGVVVVEES